MLTARLPFTADALAAALNAVGSEDIPVSPPWVADLADVPGDLTELAVYAPDADPAAVVSLVSYFLCGPLAMFGEWAAAWAEIDGPVIRFAPDLTKSRRDDPYDVLTDPETGLAAWLRTGSPLRTTDRAGAGTRGTRACPPLPGPALLLWR